MRAVIYTRVSSEGQVEGFSLDAQADICRKLIDTRGWTLVDSYSDEGISAKTTDRPDFQRMMFDAQLGRFDVIVVHKLDRFSRSVTDLLITLRELEKDGVSLVSATEQFDFSTPIGKVLLTLLAAFAQWYLDNLAMEVAKGKRARAQAGLWNNRLPFGYTADYKINGGDGIAIPDEHDAEGVRLAFEMYASGEYSYADIARTLNEKGYRPTGRVGRMALPVWTKDAVVVLLKNRFYIGEVSYRGEWLPGVHEPIVSRELFEKIDHMRTKRRIKNAGRGRAPSRTYLLQQLLRCQRCGAPLRGSYRLDKKSPGKEWLYYRCATRLRAMGCDQPAISAPALEEEVVSYMLRLRLPENWKERVMARLKEKASASASAAPQESEAALRNRLERLKDLYMLGDIEREEYLERRSELQARIDAIQPTTVKAPRKLSRAAELLNNFPAIWEGANARERQKLLRAFIEEIHVDKLEPPRIQFKPQLAMLFEVVETKEG